MEDLPGLDPDTRAVREAFGPASIGSAFAGDAHAMPAGTDTVNERVFCLVSVG